MQYILIIFILPLFPSCISSQCMFSSEPWWNWAFFIGVVNSPLRLKRIQKGAEEEWIKILWTDPLNIDINLLQHIRYPIRLSKWHALYYLFQSIVLTLLSLQRYIDMKDYNNFCYRIFKEDCFVRALLPLKHQSCRFALNIKNNTWEVELGSGVNST